VSNQPLLCGIDWNTLQRAQQLHNRVNLNQMYGFMTVLFEQELVMHLHGRHVEHCIPMDLATNCESGPPTPAQRKKWRVRRHKSLVEGGVKFVHNLLYKFCSALIGNATQRHPEGPSARIAPDVVCLWHFLMHVADNQLQRAQ
jgi:hypothetical protein